MFDRSLLNDDLGRRRSLLENDRSNNEDGLLIYLLDCGLLSIVSCLEISEWENAFVTAVLGLV